MLTELPDGTAVVRRRSGEEGLLPSSAFRYTDDDDELTGVEQSDMFSS
jgi:hypothetical protein